MPFQFIKSRPDDRSSYRYFCVVDMPSLSKKQAFYQSSGTSAGSTLPKTWFPCEGIDENDHVIKTGDVIYSRYVSYADAASEAPCSRTRELFQKHSSSRIMHDDVRRMVSLEHAEASKALSGFTKEQATFFQCSGAHDILAKNINDKQCGRYLKKFDKKSEFEMKEVEWSSLNISLMGLGADLSGVGVQAHDSMKTALLSSRYDSSYTTTNPDMVFSKEDQKGEGKSSDCCNCVIL